jgi:hypothetical protein
VDLFAAAHYIERELYGRGESGLVSSSGRVFAASIGFTFGFEHELTRAPPSL